MAEKTDLLRGTLDLLILQSLVHGPNHGLGVARRIEQMTAGAFDVGPWLALPGTASPRRERVARGRMG